MTKDEYQKRRQDIRETKPEDERPLRLYLMRPVNGKLPSSIYKARADYKKTRKDYKKARVDYNKARVDYDKAWEDYKNAWKGHKKARVDYDKVIQKHMKEILTLHKKEIPDSTWDGKTIFSDSWKEHPKAFF